MANNNQAVGASLPTQQANKDICETETNRFFDLWSLIMLGTCLRFLRANRTMKDESWKNLHKDAKIVKRTSGRCLTELLNVFIGFTKELNIDTKRSVLADSNDALTAKWNNNLDKTIKTFFNPGIKRYEKLCAAENISGAVQDGDETVAELDAGDSANYAQLWFVSMMCYRRAILLEDELSKRAVKNSGKENFSAVQEALGEIRNFIRNMRNDLFEFAALNLSDGGGQGDEKEVVSKVAELPIKFQAIVDNTEYNKNFSDSLPKAEAEI